MTMPTDLDEMVARLRDVHNGFTKGPTAVAKAVAGFSGAYRVSLGGRPVQWREGQRLWRRQSSASAEAYGVSLVRRRVQWRAREPRVGIMRNKRMPMTRLMAAERRKIRDGSGWPSRIMAYCATG